MAIGFLEHNFWRADMIGFRKHISFEEYLRTVNFKSQKESDLVNNALLQLKDKQNEHMVRGNLILGLELLATKQEISKEGLDFLSQLSRPNFNNDLARSINLWV